MAGEAVRMTPERELLDLIEQGCPQGVLFKRRMRQRAQHKRTFVRTMILPGCAVCLAGYLVVSFTRQAPTVAVSLPAPRNEIPAMVSLQAPVPVVSDAVLPAVAGDRLVPSAETIALQPVAGVEQRYPGARVEDLRLVGISWSDDPDAMIEDASRGVTLFLKKGQVIDGGIAVRDIYKDKVVLESHGKTVELQ